MRCVARPGDSVAVLGDAQTRAGAKRVLQTPRCWRPREAERSSWRPPLQRRAGHSWRRGLQPRPRRKRYEAGGGRGRFLAAPRAAFLAFGRSRPRPSVEAAAARGLSPSATAALPRRPGAPPVVSSAAPPAATGRPGAYRLPAAAAPGAPSAHCRRRLRRLLRPPEWMLSGHRRWPRPRMRSRGMTRSPLQARTPAGARAWAMSAGALRLFLSPAGNKAAYRGAAQALQAPHAHAGADNCARPGGPAPAPDSAPVPAAAAPAEQESKGDGSNGAAQAAADGALPEGWLERRTPSRAASTTTTRRRGVVVTRPRLCRVEESAKAGQ